MNWAMPMVSMPDSAIVPPPMIRCTLGWPNTSALSRLLRMRRANRGLVPLALASAMMFSRIAATVASITASSSAAVRPQRPRNPASGESSRTPAPPQMAVLARAPSKSRNRVCWVPEGRASVPGRYASSVTS
jgi:hypothetical protein